MNNIDSFDSAYKEVLPCGFYYDTKRGVSTSGDERTKDEWVRLLKLMCGFNDTDFINEIKDLSEEKFVKELNVQYAYFNRKRNKNMVLWLLHTEKLIFKKIGNKYLLFAFDEWLSTKRPIREELEVKNEIFLKLIGLIGNHNNPNTIQPVYYYINDVLKYNNLNPIQAIEIVLQMAGSVSPDWNKNVIPFIIDYLKEIQTLSQPQPQKSLPIIEENKEPENPFKRIFINGYAYELFLKLKEEIAVDQKKDYSNYSFIFQSMLTDEYLLQTNHKKLIDFLDNEFKTSIGLKYNQFNTSDTLEKKKVYSRYNKHFKPKIKSLL